VISILKYILFLNFKRQFQASVRLRMWTRLNALILNNDLNDNDMKIFDKIKNMIGLKSVQAKTIQSNHDQEVIF